MAPRKATAAKKTAPAKATKATARKAATKKTDTPPPNPAELKANAELVGAVSGSSSTLAFLTELEALVKRHINAINNGTVSDAGVDDAPVTATDDEPPAPQSRDEREAEISGWSVAQLRAALIAAKDEDGDPVFDEKEIKAEKDKDVLVSGLLSFEFEDDEDGDSDDEEDEDEDTDEVDEEDADEEDEDEEDDEDEEEDEEDEDDEDEEITRESILALSLAEAKKLAREQYGATAADLKGLDKDAIADMILGEGDEEDDEDEDAEEEEEFWTTEELMELPIKEVREIATEAGIKFTTAQGKDKAKLAELITAE